VKFFQDLTIENGKDSHENCCKYMTFEFFAADETIFQLGSAGFKFYIILKGSVGVFVNIPKTIEEINEKGETLKRIEYVLTDVRTLNTGASFGELALIDNKPRAATIKCKSDSYFAVLEKKDFNVILSN
jgi:CRP-like cAMP-binding protein